MNLRPVQRAFCGGETFDMTPIIDVVFLLIIFFMLVCQFIVAENFEVQVPEEIVTAHDSRGHEDLMTTVTVMEGADGRVEFAVGSRTLTLEDFRSAPALIAAAIDEQLRPVRTDLRVVRLRCQKTVPFGMVKYALEGISRSTASDIQWAVFKKD